MQWLNLSNLPPEGREFELSSSNEWLDFVRQFGLKFKLAMPLEMIFTVLPQRKGFLVHGQLKGKAIFECDRCLEPVEIEVEIRFDFFEEKEPTDPENLGEPLLRYHDGHFELNVFQVMWEQFLLSLPEKRLCSPECKGLCPKCGKNLNAGPCACEQSQGDPRLAIFRQLKIN